MRTHVWLFAAAALLSVGYPGRLAGQQAATDWRAVAAKIVERMALVRGERVLLVAAPPTPPTGIADSVVPPLRAAVRAAGGTDLGVLAGGETPREWETDFTRAARGRTGAALDAHLTRVDIAVMLPGAPDTPYVAMQRILRSGRARTIHFHWSGAYTMDAAVLPVTPEIARAYERAVLTTNYSALARTQQALERAMRGRVVRVTTPAGTDLQFEIGDRQVTKQDGDASAARARLARTLIDREIELPAGAIRVAPIEETVSGRIAFPPSDWGGERVEGLMMTFEQGGLTGFEARTGRAGVERELASGGAAARAFREFALGMNRLLAIPATGTRWIPYYGYGAGVVRLSLGDNTELGGKVTGGYVRWNFFTDATVIIGDKVWVRDGTLLR